MLSFTRALCLATICLGATVANAAEPPKDSPFGQAGATPAVTSSLENLDFAGVSTVGKRTMINLYDKQAKRSFWVEAGVKAGDVTVTNYDSAHDQITIKRNGTEKILPLRPPSAVVNGTGPTPIAPAASPALSAPAPATPTATPTTTLSQARQEEEARMLVSDLLEIGMAQRRAYEEAQKKAASGQSAQPPSAAPAATPATEPAAGQPTGQQAAPAATTATPSS